MKVVRIALLALTMLVAASVSPALAAPGTNAGGNNPSQTCADNAFLVEFAPGVTLPLEIASHGGCVSTVASRGAVVAPGDYSQSAYVAQCKLLKSVLPSELWNAPVAIIETEEGPSNVGGFGGKIETCTQLLRAYHSGTLSHPE